MFIAAKINDDIKASKNLTSSFEFNISVVAWWLSYLLYVQKCSIFTCFYVFINVSSYTHFLVVTDQN